MNEFDKLPNTTAVDKVLPKTKIYEKTKVSYSVRKEFSAKIKKITIKHKLAERTINTDKTDRVNEIFVFEIELKEKVVPKNLLKVIDKAIPCQILYRFVYKDSICWGIALKYGNKIERYYFSVWDQDIQFQIIGHNLEIVYQNLVKVFIRREAKTSDKFDEIIAKDNSIKKLEKDIQVLKNKILATKMINKKVDINKILLEKQKQLQTLKSAI